MHVECLFIWVWQRFMLELGRVVFEVRVLKVA